MFTHNIVTLAHTQGATGKKAIIRAITMDLIVNQLKGKVLATSRRLQKKYERKEERRKNGRKARIESENAVDCSVGAIRRQLSEMNVKRVEKAKNKLRIAAEKTARIGRKAVEAKKVCVTITDHHNTAPC